MLPKSGTHLESARACTTNTCQLPGDVGKPASRRWAPDRWRHSAAKIRWLAGRNESSVASKCRLTLSTQPPTALRSGLRACQLSAVAGGWQGDGCKDFGDSSQLK